MNLRNYIELVILMVLLLFTFACTSYMKAEQSLKLSILKAPENAEFVVIGVDHMKSLVERDLKRAPSWGPDPYYAAVPVDVMKWAVAQAGLTKNELGKQMEGYLWSNYNIDTNQYHIFRPETNDCDDLARTLSAVVSWLIGIRYDINTAGVPVSTFSVFQKHSWGGIPGDPNPISGRHELVWFIAINYAGELETWIIEPSTGYMGPSKAYPNDVFKI